jgi:hypothetical protein
MKHFITSGSYFFVIDYLLYIVLIGAVSWTVYLLVHGTLRDKFSQIRYRTRLKRTRMISKEVPLSKRSAFYRNIYFLLESVQAISSKKRKTDSITVYGFILFSILVGLFFFVLIVVKFEDAFIALLIGGIISLIPYTVLLIRLRNTRNAVGNQLTELVELIIHAYSAASNDMYQTLKITHANIQEKELRRIFIKLISDLQTARNEEEMRLSIDLFIYSSGNSWAMRLGNIILKSYLYQENVLNALLQLQTQMINNEKMLEQEKAGSYDAFYDAMLSIVLFPVSLIGANYIVVKPQSWAAIQFGQKAALLSFIVTTLLVIISLLVGLLIRKPKNDL